VTVIQRFGSGLNLNPHFHTLLFDGVFFEGPEGALEFRPLPPPTEHRLAAIYASMEFVGGLIVYGVNYPDQYRRAARFADRLFKGANPADLPVEQLTKFELVINLKNRQGPRRPM